MIGILPESLTIDGKNYPIRSDFRVALLIFQAYDDDLLNPYEKSMVCLECLFEKVPKNQQAALESAVWFLDGGNMPKSKEYNRRMMDWEHDESIIFPALNKVYGGEIRTEKNMHWWTFLGLFNEIGDGLYSSVMTIRSKMAKGKKLEKWEQEFYRDNKELIRIEQKYTPEEKAEIEKIKSML